VFTIKGLRCHLGSFTSFHAGVEAEPNPIELTANQQPTVVQRETAPIQPLYMTVLLQA